MSGRERVGGGLMKGAREEETERGREGAWEEGWSEEGREQRSEGTTHNPALALDTLVLQMKNCERVYQQCLTSKISVI